MKLISLHITDLMLDALRALVAGTGLPMSEHIRRAIDAYLKSLE